MNKYDSFFAIDPVFEQQHPPQVREHGSRGITQGDWLFGKMIAEYFASIVKDKDRMEAAFLTNDIVSSEFEVEVRRVAKLARSIIDNV